MWFAMLNRILQLVETKGPALPEQIPVELRALRNSNGDTAKDADGNVIEYDNFDHTGRIIQSHLRKLCSKAAKTIVSQEPVNGYITWAKLASTFSRTGKNRITLMIREITDPVVPPNVTFLEWVHDWEKS